jgi:HPt (histidine-containing phosphotransfer) domain-containing protein
MQSENMNPAEPEKQSNHEGLSNADDSIIDIEVLNVVSNHGGDASFLVYLLNLFEKHGQQSLNELKEGLSKRDPAAVKHVAHRWRGSCLNVGAVRLAEVLGRTEEKPIQGNEDDALLDQIWKTCEDLFTRSCQQLRQQLPGTQHS